MSRLILWSLLAAFLVVVGLWPAAAAPIGLVGAGAAVVIGKIPGVVLLIGATVLYFRHRPTQPATA